MVCQNRKVILVTHNIFVFYIIVVDSSFYTNIVLQNIIGNPSFVAGQNHLDGSFIVLQIKTNHHKCSFYSSNITYSINMANTFIFTFHSSDDHIYDR